MEVKVPDIGDFTDVPVIEVLVEPGQEVAKEDPLVALESDKATMEIPSPEAGKVGEIHVSVGDKVSEGTLLLTLEGGEEPEEEEEEQPEEEEAKPQEEEANPSSSSAAAPAATRRRSAPPTSASR
jgi:pyruvate/2-oxoglutarate dehydrogenase complex dihydrolipoamide acyltransferase (E2) component